MRRAAVKQYQSLAGMKMRMSKRMLLTHKSLSLQHSFTLRRDNENPRINKRLDEALKNTSPEMAM
jgi:hypothetical protein